ncbi:MAG: hypothetical protein NTZ44_03225 [Candidatus Nomurabacteria bacterium]|nr:hypothetical protein [Candidatus Nomurabacteria bacterium]
MCSDIVHNKKINKKTSKTMKLKLNLFKNVAILGEMHIKNGDHKGKTPFPQTVKSHPRINVVGPANQIFDTGKYPVKEIPDENHVVYFKASDLLPDSESIKWSAMQKQLRKTGFVHCSIESAGKIAMKLPTTKRKGKFFIHTRKTKTTFGPANIVVHINGKIEVLGQVFKEETNIPLDTIIFAQIPN